LHQVLLHALAVLVEISPFAVAGIEAPELVLLAADGERGVKRIAFLHGAALFVEFAAEIDSERVARLDLALEIDAVGVHTDRLDDDLRRYSCAFAIEEERVVDRSGGAHEAFREFVHDLAAPEGTVFVARY